MYFVVIPFFLAASPASLTTTNNPDLWSQPPEYIFKFRVDYSIFDDATQDPWHEVNQTATMKCQPRTEERLLCWLEDVEDSSKTDAPKILLIEKPFEIKFNETGVESLWFEDSRESIGTTFVKILASMFSVGTDLRKYSNSFPTFVAKEHTILGECDTLYTITRQNHQPGGVQFEGTKDFGLNLISLPQIRQGHDLVIDKRIDFNRCSGNEDILKRLDQIGVSMAKTTSRIEISNTFKSETSVHMKLTKKNMKKNNISRYTASLTLQRIRPSSGQLPETSFTTGGNLHFYQATKNNMIF